MKLPEALDNLRTAIKEEGYCDPAAAWALGRPLLAWLSRNDMRSSVIGAVDRVGEQLAAAAARVSKEVEGAGPALEWCMPNHVPERPTRFLGVASRGRIVLLGGCIPSADVLTALTIDARGDGRGATVDVEDLIVVENDSRLHTTANLLGLRVHTLDLTEGLGE